MARKIATGDFSKRPNGEINLRVWYLDGRHWEVSQNRDNPFYFRVRTYDGHEAMDLLSPPDGFRTDFASIPRFFYRILPPTGDGPKADYGPAAVIHDLLYRRGGGRTSRRYADDVFLAAMKKSGVSAWKRQAMYRAVRAFGWTTFGKDLTPR